MKRQQGTAWLVIVVVAVAVTAAIGCAKEPEIGTTSPAGPAASAPPPSGPPPAPPRSETAVTQPPAPRETTVTPTPQPTATQASPLKDVYFDYDASTLTDEAKRVLNGDIAWLKANPRGQITLEGHCDERGTSEYNLGLGDRRAKAVREYLVAAGVDGRRIRTISYGKERPFVQGHDESAWRWNRRAHFEIAGR